MAKPQFKCPKTPLGLAQAAQPRSPSESADHYLPAGVVYRDAQRKTAEGPGPNMNDRGVQTSPYGAAASLPKSDDGRVDGDVSFHEPGAPQTTSATHPTPPPDSSAGFAPPLSSNRSKLDDLDLPHDARD